ncbi:hypothetical protein [Streptomyces sp. ISL-87]|uniref:hypothetical protein n=1 Tax=Streptomyces sp. ISL-87 TaxID=2819188 RepID=UPI001BE83E71|nr:hypothetical protein [Streptomyces sp. ISL-87]
MAVLGLRDLVHGEDRERPLQELPVNRPSLPVRPTPHERDGRTETQPPARPHPKPGS